MSKDCKEKEALECEMLHEFIHAMNLSQLEKLTTYAVKLLNDKRYKNEKTKIN